MGCRLLDVPLENKLPGEAALVGEQISPSSSDSLVAVLVDGHNRTFLGFLASSHLRSRLGQALLPDGFGPVVSWQEARSLYEGMSAQSLQCGEVASNTLGSCQARGADSSSSVVFFLAPL